MITVPVSKPALIKAITIGTGVASVVVAQFLPQYASTWTEVLRILGVFGIGAGSIQIVNAPQPKASVE